MRSEKIVHSRANAPIPAKFLAGLVAELRVALAALMAPALWVALVVLLLVLLLVPQLPLRYSFDVGYEEGVGSDLPFLRGFNTAEQGAQGSYRWTDDGATIRVPGVGRRALMVTLEFLPIAAEVAASGPQTIDVLAQNRLVATLPVRAVGGAQSLIVPPAMLRNGRLELELRTATFSPAGDPRRLGTPLDRISVHALPSGLAAPDWSAALSWLGVVTLGWLTLVAALTQPIKHRTRGNLTASELLAPSVSSAVQQHSAVWGLALGVALAALAALLDPPRWAFGAPAALTACGLALGLALAVRAGLPPLARRLGLPLDAARLGWLTLFVAVSFALRYGGRLYPDSMHGDIGFHHNRFNDAVWGLIFILSKNRGVDFPYPPGPYLLIAPFTLLGLQPRALLELGAALVDALSAPVLYAIAVRPLGQRAALLAAAIYVFTAATFMTSWWSFDTHIYSQFFHLLLVTALVLALPLWAEQQRGRTSWILAAGVLLVLVFLGHFGFLINTTLLGGLLVAALWLNSWRGAGWARQARWPLTIALMSAGLFAALCFYTAYIPLFLGQLETASTDGLTAVAGRGPVDRAVLWETLWRAGLVTHFGLFPLLLAPVGLAMLWRRASSEPRLSPRRAVLWLMMGSFAIALVFAALPFVTGVTNSPRWMLFVAWAVALGAAAATEALWRSGRFGRLATLIMGAVVLANTVWIWLAPMLWRVRPPEPF